LKESWNPPLFDQSEKVLQHTFVTTTGVIGHSL